MFTLKSSILLPENAGDDAFLKGDSYVLLFNGDPEIAPLFKSKIQTSFKENPPQNLDEIQKNIQKIIEMYHYKGALCVLYIVKDIVYVVSIGTGEISLHRNNDLIHIIDADNVASGYIKPKDLYIVGFSSALMAINEDTFKESIKKTPEQIISQLDPSRKNISAPIAFIQVEENEEKEESESKKRKVEFVQQDEPIENDKKDEEEIVEKTLKEPSKFGQNFRDKVAMYTEQSKGRKITVVIAILLLILFIWSVGFGVQRRLKNQTATIIKTYEEKIDTKLSEASDLATLNTERAQLLIQESKQDVSELKTKVHKDDEQVVQKILEKINTAEKKMFKQEDRTATEFYNLDLISSKAHGQALDLQNNNLSVLNADDGEIYTISVEKKSKDVITNAAIKNARLITQYEDQIFISKSDGVYKIADEKFQQAIKADEWGDIKGMAVFNGNIYLVDSTKNQIYKYLVGEKGYSDKQFYVKDAETNLSSATSLQIDGSVYVSTLNSILKYTSGAPERFDLVLPNDQSIEIKKMVTNEELDKVYIFDSIHGKVFVSTKDGEYERQIESSTLKGAQDIAVSEKEKSIFVLVKNKIYKIGLN